MKAINRYLLYALVLAALSGCNTKPHYVDISGKVIDIQSGTPVVGILVEASSFGPSKEKTSNSQTAYTDGNGEFSIPHFKMVYTQNNFVNQKSSDAYLAIGGTDYWQYNSVGSKIGKHASKYYAVIYATCLAKGTFSIVVNGAYTWDYGLVTGQACMPNNPSSCITFAGSMGDGLYGFYPASPGSFDLKIPSGSLYKSYITTRLYNGGALVKTQVDTVTGQICKSSFNYTIAIN